MTGAVFLPFFGFGSTVFLPVVFLETGGFTDCFFITFFAGALFLDEDFFTADFFPLEAGFLTAVFFAEGLDDFFTAVAATFALSFGFAGDFAFAAFFLSGNASVPVLFFATAFLESVFLTAKVDAPDLFVFGFFGFVAVLAFPAGIGFV